jgi:cell division control protein 45
MLLDHWTLFDSLCNSNFVIAKFRLWTEEGRRELLNFLAQWGIPIQQAKQLYNCMETEFKTKLRQNLVQVFREKKLEENVQPCFVR